MLELSAVAIQLAKKLFSSPLRLTYIEGSVLDTTVLPGPFGAIIERCTLQLFNDTDLPLALAANVRRLRNRGLIISHLSLRLSITRPSPGAVVVRGARLGSGANLDGCGSAVPG